MKQQRNPKYQARFEFGMRLTMPEKRFIDRMAAKKHISKTAFVRLRIFYDMPMEK